jgi:hypothetical protein
MTSPLRRLLVAMGILWLLGMASPAVASFWASDLIYLPAVAHTDGASGSQWRTDLYVTNVDSVPIDVMMVYLPSGGGSNSSVFTDRTSWLGGREADGFGHVNEALADIQPNGTVVLEDVIGEYWADQAEIAGLGGMVIFAYEADSLEDDGTRVFRNAALMSRTYNETMILLDDPNSHGGVRQVDATYGQTMPGVPWYNLADPAAVSEDTDFSFYVLTGGIQNEDFRYNVGILNASDPQTSITISLQPFRPNGEPFPDVNGDPIISLTQISPLGHLQLNEVLLTSFGLAAAEQVMIRVAFVGWTSSSTDPIPAFATYGSVIDDRSNDPTTILQSFAYPYDVECMWPDSGDGTGVRKSRRGVSFRPVQAPSLRTAD